MKKRHSTPLWEGQTSADADCRPELAAQNRSLQLHSKLLNPADRTLLEMICQGRQTQAQIASLMGLSESSLSAHIRRLVSILGREFPALLAAAGRSKTGDWKILRLSILHNRSLDAMARHTGLSRYQVKKIVAGLKRFRTAKRHIS